ncbi:MAG: hypothetical protein ACOYNL_06070 [Rickettsiales bacterium]
MRFDNIDSLRADQMDFVPRARRNQVRNLMIAFAITIAVIVILSPSTIPTIILLLLLGGYATYQKQTNLDLVMSTEFQNMLFSQALNVGSAFTMIIRRDGTIVHASESVSGILPNYDYGQAQTIDGLIGTTIAQPGRDRILAAVMTSGRERVVFPITALDGTKKNYILSVEPLARPAGYTLARGREYLGQRNSDSFIFDAAQ